ncbi:hypothetical protein E2C01_073610 [Portunus trituberculatus]|uniref:Uncharacterized protein n=1 Tax=Portunus trituberculatus TaxID=210409 RepID=A0A5B7IC56_PORTR|nr:hypothetical protein [Portunus trituberculatus]
MDRDGSAACGHSKQWLHEYDAPLTPPLGQEGHPHANHCWGRKEKQEEKQKMEVVVVWRRRKKSRKRRKWCT